jgi:hypothetical protein
MLILFYGITQASALQLWIDLADINRKHMLQNQSVDFLEQQQDSWMLFEGDEQLVTFLDANNIPYLHHDPIHRSRPNGYSSAEDMVSQLYTLSTEYPDLVSVHQLGSSINERPIIALRISRSEDPILSWRILGAHHGDELSSAAVTYQFAEAILDKSDSTLSSWFDKHAIWIVPHINPDGIEYTSRRNANNVDLNRNYSYEWSGQGLSGDYPFSEPETNAVRILEDWNSFTAGLSLHSGIANLSWVWNYVTVPTIDDSLIRAIAVEYAERCTQPGFELINGAEWYVTHGDTTDWSYGAQGTFDFTLEVSSDKIPPASEINAIVNYHLEPMQNFIQWPFWIAAELTDETTLKPINGSMTMLEDGWTTNSGPMGKISRLVESEGPWTVELSSPGYQPQIATINAGTPTEITLTPETITTEIDCSFHDIGEVNLDLPSTIEEAELYRGIEWITLLEENSLWQSTGSELLSGVYHLKSNQGWFSNRVLIVDDQTEINLDEEQSSFVFSGEQFDGEQFWQVSHGQLTPLEIDQQDDGSRQVLLSSYQAEDCLLLLTKGQLFELRNTDSSIEPSSEPSEPTNEPDPTDTEPIEPSQDPLNNDNSVDELKAGCQSIPTKTPWLLSFLIAIGLRRPTSSADRIL